MVGVKTSVYPFPVLRCGSDLLTGLESRNRSLEIEAHVCSLDPEPLAHTRSTTLLNQDPKSQFKLQMAREIDMLQIIEVMNEATVYAAHRISELPGVIIDKKYNNTTPVNGYRMKYSLDKAKERVLSSISSQLFCPQNSSVVVDGVKMSVATGMAVYGNGGKTSLPSTSRASRFYGYMFKDVTMSTGCSQDNCHHYAIGDIYDTSNSGRGRIVALSYKKNEKGLSYPAKILCRCSGTNLIAWVKVTISVIKKSTIIKVKL